MHILTSCPWCSRQYDTIGQAPGARFHCICGATLVVPGEKSHTASVVRCSACGGVRGDNADTCGFCGAGFTLVEKDLGTVCPQCSARISNYARFCHHCGVGITVVGTAGEHTDAVCPACRDERQLSSRKIRNSQFSALECNHCAGLWLETPVFLEIERLTVEIAASGAGDEHRKHRGNTRRQHLDDQNLYRKCPACQVLMHRKNYGPGSGVIVDHCREHGFWFDLDELSVILRWIRTGGLLAASKRRAHMRRDDDRLARILQSIEENREKLRRSGNSKYFPG